MKNLKFISYLILSIILAFSFSLLNLTERKVNYFNEYDSRLNLNDDIVLSEIMNSNDSNIDSISLVFDFTKKKSKNSNNFRIFDVEKYYETKIPDINLDNQKKVIFIEIVYKDKKNIKSLYLSDLKYGTNYIKNDIHLKNVKYEDVLINIRTQNIDKKDKIYAYMNNTKYYSVNTQINGITQTSEMSIITNTHIRTLLPIIFFIAIIAIGFLYKTRSYKIFNKLNFSFIILLDLILSIAYSYSILKFNISFEYEMFDKLYFVIAVTSLLINLKLILEIIKKYNKQIEKIFAVIAIFIGSMYVFTLLLNGVPDENHHYYQADKLSELKFENNHYYYISKKFNACGENERNYKCLNEKIFNANYDDYGESYVNNADAYSELLYIPSALGIKIGKLLGNKIYVGYYIARLFNLLLTVLFGYFSIKLLPKGKLILFTYLLNPMYMHQGMAISADVLTNAVTILFISLILNKEEFTFKRKILLLLLLAGFTIIKTPYLFLLILLLLRSKKQIPDDKLKLIKKIFAYLIVIFIVYIIITNLNYTIYKDYSIMNIIRNPFDFIIILTNTLVNNGGKYFMQIFGTSLGWFEFDINSIYTIAYMGILLLATIIDKIRLSKKQIIISLIGSLLVILSIFIGFLSIYSHRSEEVIFGIQGRYFIPPMLLLLYILSSVFDKYKIEINTGIKNYTSFISISLLIIHILIILQLTNYML